MSGIENIATIKGLFVFIVKHQVTMFENRESIKYLNEIWLTQGFECWIPEESEAAWEIAKIELKTNTTKH